MAAAAPESLGGRVFEEGFTWKTALGALFIALIMVPGGIYLGLAAGWGVGDAAEWVTIVLFAEVCRRSFTPLRKQEIYILFYMAASLTTVVNQARGLGGGPFSNLVWHAYFMTSEAAKPLAGQIPTWAIPPADSAAIAERSLWHPAWWVPIALLVATDLCGRLSWMSLGYALFRVTRDVERLPFPMAPVAASGATALADAGTESWRWKTFSTGAVVGMLFGAVYVALPVLTGMVLGRPIELLPIPFADFTVGMESVLPGAIVGISLSLGNILVGFVLPFEIVLGATISSILAMIVINPLLYQAGMLPNYRLGSNAFLAKLTSDMDFWLSVGIGVNLAIAVLGIVMVARAFGQARKQRRERYWTVEPPKGRGDVPMWSAIGVWFGSTLALVALCAWLVPTFPLWILVVFGFLWTPINSYISARMHGLTGRGVGFPYLRESTVIASGYPRADIWYAPMPLFDHGWAAQRFREVELTETKLTSIFKAEAMMFPLIMIASFAFWAFFWRTSAIPSPQFPYAQKFWPPEATMQAVVQQINVPKSDGGSNWFMAAIKPHLIGAGLAGGLASYGLLSLLKAPLLFFYGFAGGIGIFPAYTIPQLFGAWLGKRYFARKFGQEEWMRMAPVLLAGFSCGTGLVAMAAIAFAMLAKAVSFGAY
jgi:hypothetical protein